MGVRVILTTGGTGGRIFPTSVVAGRLRHEGIELLFVDSWYGSKTKLVKQAGLGSRGLSVRGMPEHNLRSVDALWELFRAVFMAGVIVEDFQPDVAISFGAYTSLPSPVTTRLSSIPIATHEQNAMPSLTNRMLTRLVKWAFLFLPDITGASDAKRGQLTGSPVREAIMESRKNTVRYPDTRRLLIMGGSRGMKAINSIILAGLKRLTKAGIEIRHQTGSFDLECVPAGYRAHGIDASGVTPSIEDVVAAYQRVDLVLCQAEATPVAELAIARRAAVLAPFPYATHDHQIYDVQVVVDRGAAPLVAEKDLPHLGTGGMLVNPLLDPGTLRTVSQMTHTCARPNAAPKVAQGILTPYRRN